MRILTILKIILFYKLTLDTPNKIAAMLFYDIL